MSKYIFALILITSCLSSCSKVMFNPYHSTASLPYYSITVKTDTRYIESKYDRGNTEEYGIFACLDSVEAKYLIVAPTFPNYRDSDEPYKRYSMFHSICLMPSEAMELLRIVRNAIESWDKEKTINDALYYEYYLAPESEIRKVSENVAEWNPTLKFWYQLNNAGSLSYLIIGEGIFKHDVELDKKAEVEELEYLLTQGLKELESM